MSEIKIYKNTIETVEPMMIAGWPGMGSVASGVVNYLRRKLRTAKIAEIKLDPLQMLDSVIVEDGVAAMPSPPQNSFYYAKSAGLIIFEGEAQLAGSEGLDLLNKVLDIAQQYNTKKICTAAAFPMPVSYKDKPQVYSAVNKKLLLSDVLLKLGVTPMEEGHISGLNGLLLGFARDRNMDALCLLATMPQYAIGLPNPKASYAIIEVLQRMLGLKIDLQELEDFVREMEDKMSGVEDKVKDVLTIDKEASAPVQATDKKIPAYIMEKIEKLFAEAKTDKAKAIILKNELDRWDLYKAYEDKFLDLFKDSQ